MVGQMCIGFGDPNLNLQDLPKTSPCLIQPTKCCCPYLVRQPSYSSSSGFKKGEENPSRRNVLAHHSPFLPSPHFLSSPLHFLLCHISPPLWSPKGRRKQGASQMSQPCKSLLSHSQWCREEGLAPRRNSDVINRRYLNSGV